MAQAMRAECLPSGETAEMGAQLWKREKSSGKV